MHERTRRLICRCLFGTLCVLPTVFVLGVAATRSRPGHVRSCTARLSDQLGLTVALGDVSCPRPGVTLFKQLRLADPETGNSIARIRLVEIVRRDGAMVLVASQPEVERDGFWHLCQMLHDWVLCRFGSDHAAVHFLGGEVTLHGDDGSQTLSDVRGQIDSSPAGPRARLDFRVAGIDMAEPVQIRILRNRQIAPPATRVEFHSGGSALPCSMLSTYVPALSQVGERCRFRGSIWASREADGWAGELSGRLTEVDLDRLVSDGFPHKLSGLAEIVISRARFHRGRLVEATGSLSASGGVVGQSLLEALVESMHLSPKGRTDQSAGGLVQYGELAFGFTIDASGLTLCGQCNPAPPGTVLLGRSGPLLGEPAYQPLPVVGLVRALVPFSEVQVPATHETDAVLHVLPVPHLDSRKAERAGAAHARLRFGGEGERR